MVEKHRIPWHPHEYTPEIISGLVPDGVCPDSVDQYSNPEYPDLPFPDAINDVTWYKDPLVSNDEPNPYEHWEPEDSEHPWYVYGPHYPPKE